MPTPQSISKMEALIKHWPEADSLDDAFLRAGIQMKDRRQRLRFRRETEKYYGTPLPSLQPKYNTENDHFCPSTLDVKKAKDAKGYITTAYINNTVLIEKFLRTLEVFADAYDFQILVKAVRYRNPTAMTNSEPYNWDKRIYPYVINEDFHINSRVVFSAASLEATVANPLAGKQIAYGRKSVIYGCSTLEVDPVASPKDELPKMLMTTGSINKPKYSNTNKGLKADAKHDVSAVLILPVGNYYRDYIIEWDGEGFSFFDEYWTPEGKDSKPASYEAIHLGDAHAEGVTRAMINQRKKLINHVNPAQVIWNDLHNHGSASHHNTFLENMTRHQNGTRNVKDEVQKSIDLVNELGAGRKNVIVGSNHHNHLEQWLNRFKPANDIENAEYYFWLMARIAADSTGKSALELAMEDQLTVDYEFIDGDRPYYVSGIDCSQHGHNGPDGARSAAGFHKVSTPTQTGHTHKRHIKGKHWSSGVIPLELGYNKGYGTWTSTDTLITTEGTRTHVTFIKGKYWK